MDLEVVGSGEGKEKMDGVGFGNRCECFGEINAGFLSETLCNQPSLVVRNFAGCGSLDTVYPLAANWFVIARRADKLEGPYGYYQVHFGLYCSLPLVTVDRIDRFLIGCRVFASCKEGGCSGELTKLWLKFIVNLHFIMFII